MNGLGPSLRPRYFPDEICSKDDEFLASCRSLLSGQRFANSSAALCRLGSITVLQITPRSMAELTGSDVISSTERASATQKPALLNTAARKYISEGS
jgi:hypothetical protein